jgi:hypothetical protein
MSSISSPTFRLFLRTVLAGFLEESKRVYEKLIDRFGDKTEEAARDIWENRNQPLFKFVGREEVSKNVINYILSLFGGEATTVPKILGLLYSVDKGKYVPPDLDTAKIAMLKNVFRQITPEIKKKLVSHFQGKPVTEQELYDELNVALKEATYMSILNNQGFFGKQEAPKPSKSTQLRYTKPTPYSGKFSPEMAYAKFSHKVMLNYIDSFDFSEEQC